MIITGVLVEIFTNEQYLVLFESFSLDVCSSNDNAMQRTMTASTVQGKMLLFPEI